TLALGARFQSAVVVTIGTTLGMLAADGLAVFAGSRLGRVIRLQPLRWIAAGLFFAFGLGAILSILGVAGPVRLSPGRPGSRTPAGREGRPDRAAVPHPHLAHILWISCEEHPKCRPRALAANSEKAQIDGDLRIDYSI